VYKQLLINAKLPTGMKGKKTELNGRSSVKRRRCALDCSAIEKEEKNNNKIMIDAQLIWTYDRSIFLFLFRTFLLVPSILYFHL
jgi:hypothetical protein